MATTAISADLVRVEDPLNLTEGVAIAGFLAGYTGNALVRHTTDLRLFAEWRTNNDLHLLEVPRVHLEIFGRMPRTRRTGWRRRLSCC